MYLLDLCLGTKNIILIIGNLAQHVLLDIVHLLLNLFELLQFERSLVFTLLSYQLFDKLCQLSYLFSKLL